MLIYVDLHCLVALNLIAVVIPPSGSGSDNSDGTPNNLERACVFTIKAAHK